MFLKNLLLVGQNHKVLFQCQILIVTNSNNKLEFLATDWLEFCKDKGYGPDRTIIALAPTGNALVTAVKSTMETDLATYGLTVQTYESRDAIRKILESSSYEKDGNPGICFGGALEKSDTAAKDYQLNMIFDDVTFERSDDSNMPNQQLDAYDKYRRKPDTDHWQMYRKGGYAYLMNLFANKILQSETADNTAYISMLNVPMKSSNYNKDDFAEAATEMWNFFILFIFLAPLYRFTFNSVNEKETKIREAMKIMGLTDSPYWLSWFTYYITINTIQSVIMLLFLLPVFENSNKLLVFLYLWFYGMTMFAFGLLIGAIFSTGKTAAIVSSMLFFLSSFLMTAVQDQTVSETIKVWASFLPAISVQLAGVNLLEFEESGVGLQFDNMSEVFKNYRFSTTLWMNVVSFFVFSLAGLYLENVLPSAVGVRKPLWFPFTKEFW